MIAMWETSGKMDGPVPGGIPSKAQRLFDLVTVSDPRLRAAFYYALRNTLVTTDLDTAVSFAYQGDRAVHRVVTLDGQIIDTSGTLSGGGKTVKRGMMGSSVAAAAAAANPEGAMSAAEVAALEEAASAASRALSDLRKRVSALEGEARELKKREHALRKALPKLEMAIQGATAIVAPLETRRDELVASGACELSADDEARVASLEEEIAATKSAAQDITRAFKVTNPLALCNGRTAHPFLSIHHRSVTVTLALTPTLTLTLALQAIEKEINSLQKQILDAGGEPVRKQREKLAKAVKAAEAAAMQVEEVKVEIKEAGKQAKKSTAASEKATKDLEAANAKQEKNTADLTVLEDEAIKVRRPARTGALAFALALALANPIARPRPHPHAHPHAYPRARRPRSRRPTRSRRRWPRPRPSR